MLALGCHLCLPSQAGGCCHGVAVVGGILAAPKAFGYSCSFSFQTVFVLLDKAEWISR